MTQVMNKQFEKYKKLGGKFADDWNEQIFSKITDEEDTSGIKLKYFPMHCDSYEHVYKYNPSNSIKLVSSPNEYISAIYVPENKVERILIDRKVVFRRKNCSASNPPLKDILKDARTIPSENKNLADYNHRYKDEINLHGEAYSRIILAYPCIPQRCGMIIHIDSESKEPFGVYLETGKADIDISEFDYFGTTYEYGGKWINRYYYSDGLYAYDYCSNKTDEATEIGFVRDIGARCLGDHYTNC